MLAHKTHFDRPIATRYRKLTVSSSPFPVLDINIKSGNKKLPGKISALVDSGSNGSILRSDVAKYLGFKFNARKAISGGLSASGTYKFFPILKYLETEIYGKKFNFKFSVIDNPKLVWPCILGHDTIFRVAKINFLSFDQHFDISFRLDLN